MRVTGMFSGLQTESIISELVSAKSTKVTKLKNDKQKLEWKQEVWQNLNSKIYSLYSSKLTKMRYESSYAKRKTSSSNENVVTVVAGDSSVLGSQTLKVNSLAKTGYLTGAKIKCKPDSQKNPEGKVAADTKLSAINSNLVGSKLKLTVGTGEVQEIEITDDMTVNGLLSKFKDAGINATFDTGNQRFFLNGKEMGTEADFTLTSDSMIDDGNGNSINALRALGLDTTATEDDYFALYGTKSNAVKLQGEDAEIVLNGATFTSDSNAFTINGLTLNVTGETTEEISIVTTTDYDGIYETIKDFFSEYNELINEIDKLYNADSARKYDMLKDEEKEAMTDEEIEQWEDKIKSALLRKDTTLSNVMNSMINMMMDGYLDTADLSEDEKNAMSASEYAAWKKEHTKYLSSYGINTLSYFEAEDNERHAYHIDGDSEDESTSANADKLKAAITEDPEGTAEFFANLCKTMYTKLGDLMARTEYSSIYKVYNDKQMQTEYDDYTTKIKEAEDELSDYEDKWYDKFTAMETALAKLQSNSSAVTSMLGTS